MSVFIKALVYTHQESIANLLDAAISTVYTMERERELNPDRADDDECMVVDGGEAAEEPEISTREKLAEIRTYSV